MDNHKTVLTVGVFDMIHYGHVELFRRAKALGDKLIVAVQDSSTVLKYKPSATLVESTEMRAYMVSAIRYVDEVVIYTDVDKLVRELDFDIFVTGGDQNHKGFQDATSWCTSHGRQVVSLPRTEGVSSSALKEQIKRQ